MDDTQRDKKMALIENQCKILMSSFDSVIIFATKYENGDTAHFVEGDGNWFARYGQVREWVNSQERVDIKGSDKEP
jgi:hypothetical protein